MVIVNPNRETIRNIMVSVLIVVVTLATVWVAISFGKLAFIGVIGAIGLLVAAYVGVRHPLWLFYALAAILAGLQFGRIPGISLPMYLPLAFGAVVASYFHPRLARSMHPLELAWIALIITSGITMAVNAKGFVDYSLYIRWLIPSMVLFALVQLPRENLKRFGQIFAVVAAANGLFGMYMVAFDQNNTALRIFQPFGYLPEAITPIFAQGGDGVTGSIRLGGTWVNANGAGINLALAVGLSVLLFAGWQRTVLVLITTTALLLTLSRASIFSVVVGVVLVLTFGAMRARDRAATIGLGLVIAAGALLTPAVRDRLTSAFAGRDVGSLARADALRVFPGQMAHHWPFGWGWGRPEFLDPAYSYVFNLPSNAPLITLYRGGFLPFLAFVAVMVISIALSYRALRSNSLPLATYGGIAIGLTLVQFNLDHNVSDVPQNVLLWSILLAFVLYADEARRDAVKPEREGLNPHSAPELIPG
jgi:polysaccharide biosynthesis protein PslJ